MTAMNWTGTPGPDALGIRASVRHSVWRYRIVELEHARLSLHPVVGKDWTKQLDVPHEASADVAVRIDTVMPDGFSFYTLMGDTHETELARQTHINQERAA